MIFGCNIGEEQNPVFSLYVNPKQISSKANDIFMFIIGLPNLGKLKMIRICWNYFHAPAGGPAYSVAGQPIHITALPSPSHHADFPPPGTVISNHDLPKTTIIVDLEFNGKTKKNSWFTKWSRTLCNRKFCWEQ